MMALTLKACIRGSRQEIDEFERESMTNQGMLGIVMLIGQFEAQEH